MVPTVPTGPFLPECPRREQWTVGASQLHCGYPPILQLLNSYFFSCLSLLQLHYQHQVVQNLQWLWRQYMILLPKEAWPSEEEPLKPRALVTVVPSSCLEKAPATPELLPHYKSPLLEGHLSRQENTAFWDIRDSSTPQKTGAGVKSAYRKSIMEEILVEENLDMDSPLSAWDMDSLSLPKWSLCLQDFRKVLTRPWGGDGMPA